MSQTIHQKIEESPFKNVYWFARHLINTDQYGALGKEKEAKLLGIVSILENIISQSEMTEDEKLLV